MYHANENIPFIRAISWITLSDSFGQKFSILLLAQRCDIGKISQELISIFTQWANCFEKYLELASNISQLCLPPRTYRARLTWIRLARAWTQGEREAGKGGQRWALNSMVDIPFETTKKEQQDHFAQQWAVISTTVIADRFTGKSREFW